MLISCEEKNDHCVQEIPEYCSSIRCSTDNEPVCGCDGVTYQNSCMAECGAGITQYEAGECK